MSEQQKTIMLVDDSRENLKYLQALLKTADYRVLPAPSGKLALQALEHSVPDLMLLDVQMPEMDGMEVCRTVRQQQKLTDLPIVFVTGTTDDDERRAMMDCGARDILTKPFSMQQLMTMIERHLG